MNSNLRSKWQLRIATLVIFMIGFIAGALAMNIYRGRPWSFSRANARGGFEQMLDRLNLTSEQRTQVDAIFDDAREQLTGLRKESEPRFREVRTHIDDQLKSILTPEQWEQYRQMTDEFRRNRPHRGPRRERTRH